VTRDQKGDGTMGLLSNKTDEEKAAERAAKEERHRQEARARNEARLEKERTTAARAAAEETHTASLPKWEYQVKRVGEDKQKGLLGSQRMEEIFNGEGAKGWELVAIHEERATFKRPRV
jgi:hypothetical protein